jgi:ATP-dependent exoDNAse (exonuclease V) beta subunit
MSLAKEDDESHNVEGLSPSVWVYRLPSEGPQTMLPSMSALSLFSRADSEATAVRDYQEWDDTRRTTLVAGRRSAPINTVSDLTAHALLESEGLERQYASDTAREGDRFDRLRFGRVVHTALCNAQRHDAMRSIGFPLPVWWSLHEKKHVERLVQETLTSSLMQRARKSDIRFAETPFSLHVDGQLLEGIIDFAFLENGFWTIVDFKTDQIAQEHTAIRAAVYRPQLYLYALALERLTQRPVTELIIFFVRLQRSVTFSWNENERLMAKTLLQTTPGVEETDE